jgi:outer membrane protein assembly factor BamB
MKKSALFLALTLLLPSIFVAAEYRVDCKVTTPDTRNVMLCDGERFYPVAADGSCKLEVSTGCEPFVYLRFPHDLRADGNTSIALKPGDNQIAFTLEKRSSVPEKFTFIHGSDIQYDFLTKGAELANDMAEIRDVIKEYNCAFITFPGDMTEFGETPQLEKLKLEMDRAGFPRHVIWGGHDGLKSKPKLKNFTECFGAPYYSWNYGGIHFMAPLSEFRLVIPEERDRQFKWIENNLKLLPPDTPVMVVTHDPPYLAEFIEKHIRRNKLRLLGYLGAHYHYDNIFHSGGILSIYNNPLRFHDAGTFTKKLRLIECSAKDGILSTRSRYLNQRQRVHAFQSGDRNLAAFVYDTVYDPQQVICVDAKGVKTELKRSGDFIWTAGIPAATPPLKFEAKAGTNGWSKTITPAQAPELLWTHVTGNTFFHYPKPSVHGDKLFIGLSADNLDSVSGGVLCLDRLTGKQLWRTLSGTNVAGGAVSDGTSVYALTNDGELLVLDARDGKLLRRHFLPGVETAPPSSWRQAQAPMLLADGKLLIHYFYNGGGYLHCIDPSNGKSIWKKPASFGPGNVAHGFTAANGKIYFSGTGCYGALNQNDGFDAWRTNENVKSSAATPLVTDDAVYYYLRASVRKVDPATGKIIWKQSVPGSVNSIGGLTLADSKLIAFSSNAIVGLDAETGKNLYRVNLQPLPPAAGIKFQFLANTAAPVTVNGHVIAAADNGGIYRIDPATGSPAEIISSGSAFKGSPATVEDMVYFVSFEGIVYALQLK